MLNQIFTKPQRLASPGLITLMIVFFLVVGCLIPASAQSPQQTFTSASQASDALYEGIKSGDDAALHAILGAGPELMSSGNDAADKFNRDRFVQKYEEMHRLVHEPDGNTVLYVGAENWPFPIPLVAHGAQWQFDAATGSDEILARQIGESELTAIAVCQSFSRGVAPHTGNTLLDNAVEQFVAGLRQNTGTALGPFHGYFFSASPDTPGHNRVVAYPAEYRLSGVMTFTANAGHGVHQKDLGIETANVVRQIHGKPPGTWAVAQ
jgi:hypothetical protein